jgi:hypothetical protein
VTASTGPSSGYSGSVSETPAPTRRSWVGRVLRKLTEDAQELDAEDLRGDVAETGARPVANCGQGEPVTVTGRLRSVVYTPRETVPTVDAELYDGSGSVHLIWLGRRRIAGIEPGRALRARGRLSDQDGTKVIFNPWYELKPAGA